MWKTSASLEEGSYCKDRFPTLPTVPWKSLARFPHFHSPDDDSLLQTYKQQTQGDISIVLPRGTFLLCYNTRLGERLRLRAQECILIGGRQQSCTLSHGAEAVQLVRR